MSISRQPHSDEINCPICCKKLATLAFHYDSSPEGEIKFEITKGQVYQRDIYQCDHCKHYASFHQMDLSALYKGDYVSSNYKDLDGIHKTFERIINLPPEMSDNKARVDRIEKFCKVELRTESLSKIHALDIGSGLGVFPYQFQKQTSCKVLALDPDARAVQHIKEYLEIDSVKADFMEAESLGNFDLITLNKVLEHVEDPISMLKKTKSFLKPNGIVYIELPDGEEAAKDGFHREEFFIDHSHIFSYNSMEILASKSGYQIKDIGRLVEPSSKYTLFAFLKES